MKKSIIIMLFAALLVLSACGDSNTASTVSNSSENSESVSINESSYDEISSPNESSTSEESGTSEGSISDNSDESEETSDESSTQDESSESSEQPEDKNTKLVTDLLEGGIPLIDVGDRIFYTKDKMLVGSVMLDGSDRIRYSHEGLDCFAVTDSKIFCIDTTNDLTLCTMNYDGSELTYLPYKNSMRANYHTYYTEDKVHFHVPYKLVGTEIFYHEYVVSPDGSTVEEIDEIWQRESCKNKWFYTNYYDSEYEPGRLARYRYDNSEVQYLTDYTVEYMLFLIDKNEAIDEFDGWVYFIRETPGIYRIRTDGSEVQKICDDPVEPLSWYIDGEYIYYQNMNEPIEQEDPQCVVIPNALYSIRVDGSERARVLDEWTWFQFTRGDTLYYTKRTVKKPAALRSVCHDGTDKRVICADDTEVLLVTDRGFFYSATRPDSDETQVYYYEFEE